MSHDPGKKRVLQKLPRRVQPVRKEKGPPEPPPSGLPKGVNPVRFGPPGTMVSTGGDDGDREMINFAQEVLRETIDEAENVEVPGDWQSVKQPTVVPAEQLNPRDMERFERHAEAIRKSQEEFARASTETAGARQDPRPQPPTQPSSRPQQRPQGLPPEFQADNPAVGQAVHRLVSGNIPELKLDPAQTKPEEEHPHETKGFMGYCPRCFFDLSQKEVVTITDADRQSFMATVPYGARFSKEMSFVGGEVTFRFRTLTAREEQIIIDQIVRDGAKDYEAKRIRTSEYYSIRFLEYRAVLSLAAVITKRDGIREIDPVEEWDFTEYQEEIDGGETPLYAIYQYVMSEVLPSEVLRRMLNRYYNVFGDIVAKLESLVMEENFWKGSVKPP